MQESAHTFSQEYLERVLDIKPTLKVEAAGIINIITNKDVYLPAYNFEEE